MEGLLILSIIKLIYKHLFIYLCFIDKQKQTLSHYEVIDDHKKALIINIHQDVRKLKTRNSNISYNSNKTMEY